MEHQRTRVITRLLRRWGDGDQSALDDLFSRLYPELRLLAEGYFRRERPAHTLQPTALVHEAFLRVLGATGIEWRDRAHFLAVSARIMRRVLVDHARHRGFAKRGGLAVTVTLDQAPELSHSRAPDLLDLDDALTTLAGLDASQSQVVELRFFGGLTQPEIAEVLGISTATVDRRWRLARTWLFMHLQGESPAPGA